MKSSILSLLFGVLCIQTAPLVACDQTTRLDLEPEQVQISQEGIFLMLEDGERIFINQLFWEDGLFTLYSEEGECSECCKHSADEDEPQVAIQPPFWQSNHSDFLNDSNSSLPDLTDEAPKPKAIVKENFHGDKTFTFEQNWQNLDKSVEIKTDMEVTLDRHGKRTTSGSVSIAKDFN